MGAIDKMGIYRRLARSKRGMSTVFGGLFFIILILMGFNLMLWQFIQQDSYNSVLAQMNQRDQFAISENLVPQNPGASNFVNGSTPSFKILLNNLGGGSVSLARIYITTIGPQGGAPVNCTPCVADPAPSSPYSFTNGNIPQGCIYTSPSCQITVSGLDILTGSATYKIVLSTARGRLFSFYYPWPIITPPPGGGNGIFQTNVGPLSIYFDFKSFNFTQNSQTVSNSAFCMPSTGNVVFWIKVANIATDSAVTLKAQSMIQFQPYSANGFGQFIRMWIDSPTTLNPNTVAAYNEVGNPYVLAPGTVNGPGPSAIVKFSANGQGLANSQAMGNNDNWLTFIGFYYTYRGQAQGQTVPFMDFRTVASYPGGC